MYDEVTIGARLRALRRWRGMTLAQLAGQAGLSTSFLPMYGCLQHAFAVMQLPWWECYREDPAGTAS